MKLRIPRDSVAKLVDRGKWAAGRIREKSQLLVWCAQLGARNLVSRDAVVGTSDSPVVSLTSYGRRVRSCYLAIESIAGGADKPSRLILWLDDPAILDRLPRTLSRLQKRGLEIRPCHDWGPHKKCYPAAAEGVTDGRHLVTADDDLLYPAHWLQDLRRAAEDTPEMIVCHRAMAVEFDGRGIAPYTTWRHRRSPEPSLLVYPLPGAGAAYPPAMQQALREAGTAFEDVSPRNEDVWLHSLQVRHGIKARQLTSTPLRELAIPGTQASGLWMTHIRGGGTDEAISKTYAPEDVARLREA